MGDSHCPEGGGLPVSLGGGSRGGRPSSPAEDRLLGGGRAGGDGAGANSASGETSYGELNHVGWLAEHIGRLCLQPEYSDVTLVVEDVRLPAHRLVLASCSSYFRALLYGGMRESKQQDVVLQDTPLRAFELLLRYIYTGQLRLSGLQECVVLEVLELAHQYGFLELESGVSGYLERVLGVRNVCRIYDRACLYQLEPLARACRRFADRHAPAILQSDAFLQLSPSVLEEMIGRDSFFAPEVDIFRAVCSWASHNPNVQEPRPILDKVRLPLLTVQELLNVVRPTGLVCPNTLLDAIKLRTETRDADRPYRGCLLPGENVATQLHGAQVLQGEMRSALLDGDTQGYDMERGFTRHPIDEAQPPQGILVRLGAPCILNHLLLLLWDKDNRAYSYYVEVSVDQQDWVRVVDHSRYLCRSWQRLYFKPRVVQYIHIVGTHNTVNRVFHAVSLECKHVGAAGMVLSLEGAEEPFPDLEEGLVVPRENVATVARSAYVVEGVSRSRNALINGDTAKYDWDSGYTCHQLGNGAIVVQLAQPYRVDSMRLLLWDCDSRQYSYYVEVSVDQQNWNMVADKRNELCRSWQLLRFPRQPVVFVRIVGTHNTANEVFHCVHFECPAQCLETPGSTAVPATSKQGSSASTDRRSSSSSSSHDSDLSQQKQPQHL
uniref:BTB/POZ domain-containing protein 9 n=1 Tax=Amblyomma aureolatum TaxID=187763 RepID=A0A1E1XGJ9_9ACAR